jgi:acyl-CoA reductase-like NAD-dependent aldehyde dehydrogenase
MQTQTNTATGAPSPPRTERRAPATAPAPYRDITRMLIGGVWREGRSGVVAPDRNPYNGETLVEIVLANRQDVDDAYTTAERVQPAWAAVPPQERRALFERAAHIVHQRRQEIVDWLVAESGSTRAKANFEWEWVYLGMRQAADYPMNTAGRMLPASIRGKDSHVYRQPVGVVGVISPWNFPLHISVRSVAPALAVGNAVVLKPASATPVTGGLLLARIFEEAGLPPEVLSVVVGSGSELGDEFIDHPAPRVISFTGSTAVGRQVGERAGRNLKRVCLELGGNTPFIVLDDADLDRAVAAAVAGKFLHQGQICLAINRILVDERRHGEFVQRFVERVAALKTGDPAALDTDIGPLINRTQFDRVVELVADSIRLGARVLLRDQPSGLVMPPIVLDHVTSDMPVAREELFGPVAPILRFSDEDEAIRIANDTDYGLSSAIFTRDTGRGLRMAKRIDAGMTHVNDWPVNDEPNTAYGGEKASGIGRFGGEWAVQTFTTDHWISVQELPRAYPM